MTVKAPHKIQCPYCNCTPSQGFDAVEVHDKFEDDAHIRTAYRCPKCGKKSTRCYEFYAWEDEEGDEME